jgi:hypothetical protein
MTRDAFLQRERFSRIRRARQMKALHVQLQPARSPDLDVADAVARLTEVGERQTARSSVTEGYDRGRYVNVEYVTADVTGLWSSVLAVVRTVPGLSNAAIVCCQGEHGWDDYLLLYHFDPAEPLDQVA